MPYCRTVDHSVDAYSKLDHKSLHLVLQTADLVHQLTRLVGGDAGRDDGARDTAGSSERGLAGDVDIGNVLYNPVSQNVR
jgi:hypothetical protein